MPKEKTSGKQVTGRTKPSHSTSWPFPKVLISPLDPPPLAGQSKTRTQRYADMMIELGEAQ